MSLIDDTDPLERQNEKLRQIAAALMRRVEQDVDKSGAAYAQFERAAMLEEQVRARTRDLEQALDLLNLSNARLAEANRETEAARADLANAIETLQEGFAIFGADERLKMWNSRFCRLLLDVHDGLEEGLTFAGYVESVSRSRFLRLPEGEGPRDWAADRMARHADSHAIFNVSLLNDRWLQVNENRTRDGGTVIMQTDITDIMRAEREARGKLMDDQARMVRATLEHLSQGVCIFDAKGRLAGWNRQVSSLLAVPLARFRVGIEFGALSEWLESEVEFPGAIDARGLRAWVEGRARRRPLRFEIRRGAVAVLDVFAQEMPDGGFVISFNDVTTERRAAQDLARANERLEARVRSRTLELEDALSAAERANASKSRFVAAASHDLLQPLSAAKLYIASLAHGPDAAAAEVARKAGGALESAEALIEALLDISRLDSGQAAVDLCTVELGEMLAALADEFAPSAAMKGLRFRVLPTSARVRSDPGYLRRILRNLIANAIRYTDRGGVLVGARRAGGLWRVEVHDTGPGIAEEDQDAIFREFHRLQGAASASAGMGLGLAIVERACARLGHPLSLRSTPGRGTAFDLTLPPGDADTRAGASGGAPVADAAWRRDLVVLLIEADADVRRATALLLESWGVGVLDAESAGEAAALLAEVDIAPDAVLIDHRRDRPRAALDALAALRRAHGPLPARIVSAERSPELAAACGEAGAEVLTKPLSPQALERFLATL